LPIPKTVIFGLPLSVTLSDSEWSLDFGIVRFFGRFAPLE
jgi:hypothetical protein